MRMAHNPDLSHGPGGSDPDSDSGVGGGGGGGGRSVPSYRSSGRDKWWKIHLFRGMVKDVRRRAPYYWSDWRDAWDYRVVPATIYMYFAKYGWIFLVAFLLSPSHAFPHALSLILAWVCL